MKNKGSVQLDVYSYSFYLCVFICAFASKTIEQIKKGEKKMSGKTKKEEKYFKK